MKTGKTTHRFEVAVAEPTTGQAYLLECLARLPDSLAVENITEVTECLASQSRLVAAIRATEVAQANHNAAIARMTNRLTADWSQAEIDAAFA